MGTKLDRPLWRDAFRRRLNCLCDKMGLEELPLAGSICRISTGRRFQRAGMAYWKDRSMSFHFETTECLQHVRYVADLVLPEDAVSRRSNKYLERLLWRRLWGWWFWLWKWCVVLLGASGETTELERCVPWVEYLWQLLLLHFEQVAVEHCYQLEGPGRESCNSQVFFELEM